MKNIKLPSVLIISIVTSSDEYYLNLTLKSLKATLNYVKPNGVLVVIPSDLITSDIIKFYKKHDKFYYIKFFPEPLLVKSLNKTNYSYSYYVSTFIPVYTGFYNISHVLIHQWDSCVINTELWTDDFLNYDYIGAPWPFFLNYHNEINFDGYKSNVLIGNGGFSLRSSAFIKYTNYLASNKLIPINSNLISDNEDLLSCIKYQHLAEKVILRKLKFPSLELARQFSIERQFPLDSKHHHDYNDLSSYKSFGFHGDFNTAGMNYINNI